ncbi:MAG: TolC family protein [Planctomycetia bacterium]|nr:TolC family protein [Planctomycetia bacterium]
MVINMNKTALKFCQPEQWIKRNKIVFMNWFADQSIRLIFKETTIVCCFFILTVSAFGQTLTRPLQLKSERAYSNQNDNEIDSNVNAVDLGISTTERAFRSNNQTRTNQETKGNGTIQLGNIVSKDNNILEKTNIASGTGNRNFSQKTEAPSVFLGNQLDHFKRIPQNANIRNANNDNIKLVEGNLISEENNPIFSEERKSKNKEQYPKLIRRNVRFTIPKSPTPGTAYHKNIGDHFPDQQTDQNDLNRYNSNKTLNFDPSRNKTNATINQSVTVNQNAMNHSYKKTNETEPIGDFVQFNQTEKFSKNSQNRTVQQKEFNNSVASFSSNRNRYFFNDLNDNSENSKSSAHSPTESYQQAERQGKIAANVSQNRIGSDSSVLSTESSYRADSSDSGNELTETLTPDSLMLNIEDAINIALATNRQLQAKVHQTQSARANVEAAKGLRRPKIANASAYTVMNDPYKIRNNIDLSNLPPAASQMLAQMNMPTSIQLESPVSDSNFATSVTAITIPLYLGGRAQGMIESANALADAMEAGEKINELDLKFEVVQSYLLVLRIRKLKEVAQDAEITLASHEADVTRLFSNGLVTKNVVLAAQVAHAEAKQSLLKAQNGVQIAEAAFNRLLWRSLQTPVQIIDLEIPANSGDLAFLTEQAIHQRPELNALVSQQKAITAQEKVQRADRLPQIALVGSHTYLQNSHLDPNSNFTGSVGMAWMPVDGGVSRARQLSSQFEALAVAKLREDAQTAIELQVYQCWLNEQETRKRVDVAMIAVEQARENLRVVTRSFNEGLVNHTEVLDAQTLKTQAATNLAHAKYDAILATYQLARATGKF